MSGPDLFRQHKAATVHFMFSQTSAARNEQLLVQITNHKPPLPTRSTWLQLTWVVIVVYRGEWKKRGFSSSLPTVLAYTASHLETLNTRQKWIHILVKAVTAGWPVVKSQKIFSCMCLFLVFLCFSLFECSYLSKVMCVCQSWRTRPLLANKTASSRKDTELTPYLPINTKGL